MSQSKWLLEVDAEGIARWTGLCYRVRSRLTYGCGAVRCGACGACLWQVSPLRRRRWQRPKKNKGLGARVRTVRGGRCPRVLSADEQTAWPNGQGEIRGGRSAGVCKDAGGQKRSRDAAETRRRRWRRRGGRGRGRGRGGRGRRSSCSEAGRLPRYPTYLLPT